MRAKPAVVLPPVRICRDLAGISSLATLIVLERQHKGRTAGNV
jgi:hypothetical protein